MPALTVFGNNLTVGGPPLYLTVDQMQVLLNTQAQIMASPAWMM
jgi:hypothetical protein